MHISLQSIDPTGIDRAELVTFLAGNEFPFHLRANPTSEEVEQDIQAGAFDDSENKTYWLQTVEHGRIGIVGLGDLEDPTPVMDLRLDARFRGQGKGIAAIAAITEFVFTNMPEVDRFEGHTREDNVAMRKVFLRSGWVKEAHYRESWPVEGGTPIATVAYAILRRDWERGEVTPFIWEDLIG